MTDLNKHIERKDIAAMLSSYKDELDKTSTSLPRGNMSLLMQLFPHLSENAETIYKQVDSLAQFCSKVNTVPIVDRNERKKKVNDRLKRIRLSDEERSLHFAHKQKEYKVEVAEKLLELEEWYDDFLTFDGRSPNEQEFSKKLNEIQDELKELDSRINPDLFFKDGPDDVVLCGRILIKNEINWDSVQEKQAVCLFSAFQWAIRKRNETIGIMTSNTQEELKMSLSGISAETATVSIPITSDITVVDTEKEEHQEADEMDDVLKNAYSTLCDTKDEENEQKKYTLGHIYTVLKHMSCKRGKNWAQNNRTFSMHFAPLIGVTPHSIESAISRVANEIKEVSLDNMASHVAKLKDEFPFKKFEKEQLWIDIYADALQLMPLTPCTT